MSRSAGASFGTVGADELGGKIRSMKIPMAIMIAISNVGYPTKNLGCGKRDQPETSPQKINSIPIAISITGQPNSSAVPAPAMAPPIMTAATAIRS